MIEKVGDLVKHHVNRALKRGEIVTRAKGEKVQGSKGGLRPLQGLEC